MRVNLWESEESFRQSNVSQVFDILNDQTSAFTRKVPSSFLIMKNLHRTDATTFSPRNLFLVRLRCVIIGGRRREDKEKKKTSETKDLTGRNFNLTGRRRSFFFFFMD